MPRQNTPHCPRCNIDLIPQADYPIEHDLLGSIPAKLYTCQNPDDYCGYFVIIGMKSVVVQEPESVPRETMDDIEGAPV